MTRRPSVVFLLCLFFLTGAASLIYEVVWARWLVLQIGNTAFALATLLTVFMGGLALGGRLGGWLCARLSNPIRAYGVMEIGIGLYCAVLPWGIEQIRPLTTVVYRER